MKVVVVGGGIVGLAVADELTQRGIQVELLERNPRTGQEASSAAAGILSPGERERPGPFFDFLSAAFQIFPEVVQRLQRETGLDLRFFRNGMIGVAFSAAEEQDLQRQLSWQEQAGVDVRLLTAEQIHSMESAVDGSVRAGIWWPDAAQVDNTRVVEAYRRVVERQGGVIRTGIQVDRFLLESERVTGVAANGRVIQADWVVNCAGSWAGFDLGLPFPLPVEPVRGQILQYRTSARLIQSVIVSPSAYLLQRSDGELLVGTTVERVGFDSRVTEEGKAGIQAGARRMVSRLAALPLEKAWAGFRPGTPDGWPILGPSPWKRLVVAAGHYRDGILLAPLTGRLVAEWITTGGCSMDLSAFRATRFLAKAQLVS